MDPQAVQKTRYTIRSRFRWLQSCPEALFIQATHQVLIWLQNHSVAGPILHNLSRTKGGFDTQIEKIITDIPRVNSFYNPGFYSAATVQEHSVLCYKLFEAISRLNSLETRIQLFGIQCFGEYITGQDNMDVKDAITALRDVALDGVFEYLDESLDTRNIIMSLLLKYKQKTEWFQKDNLTNIAGGEGQSGKGERALARNLQEYLLDNGVDFTVEPSVSSGEPDLVLRDSNGNFIVLDAKYVKPDHQKSDIVTKLRDGFHQVYRYCNDLNEHEGFLILFKNNIAKLSLGLETADSWGFLPISSCNIYFVELDLAIQPTASRSGQATVYEISREELIRTGE